MNENDTIGVLLTRFTWIGAAISFIVWIIASRRIWKVEGSVHHLIARILSVVTMLGLDIVIFVIFWPTQLAGPLPFELTGDQIRIMVAFIVGMQVMAALWQITAPPQGRVRRVDGHRYR